MKVPKKKKEITSEVNKPFTGNIYGFFPSINMYQNSKGKLDEVWSATVKEYKILPKNEIVFRFDWDGYSYTINLKQVNSTNYQGKAMCDGEESAKVYYTLYSNEKGYALIGTWYEEGFTYDSLVEIRRN